MASSDLHVVLGAGPAGSTLATELVARGHRVGSVRRSADADAPPGVETRAADLSDPAAATAATEGAAVVYHCVNVPYHLQVAQMPGIADAILAAAQAAGARLVVLDTLYPYGPVTEGRITEDTPWAATSDKGRMRAELDRRYLDAHAAGRVRVVAGRSADFYGPGVLNSTLGGATFPPALSGEPVLTFGDIDLPHSYTYIGDVARGLATLGERSDGDGRVWHLPTVPARTTREVLDLIADAAGRPLEIDNLDEPRPYGPFDATMMAEYAEMFYQHTTPVDMDSSAFESAFGVAPTPLAQGIAATVDWYRGLMRT
jgi:nucleoside-diphosphate-sugar epimerase